MTRQSSSTLDATVSVGICLGVTECLSPYESTRLSVSSKGREEIFLTQLSSGFRCFLSLVRCKRVSLS